MGTVLSLGDLDQCRRCDEHCKREIVEPTSRIIAEDPEAEAVDPGPGSQHLEDYYDEEENEISTWEPLKMNIQSAKNLRNADISLIPFRRNYSDPYCICEIQGKPLSRTITDVIKDNLNPEWNHEAKFSDFQVGDTLLFSIFDKDVSLKKDDFLGRTSLNSDDFHPQGFSGDLPLLEAGKNQKAFLKIRIEPAIKHASEVKPKKKQAAPVPVKFTTKVTAHKYSQAKASGNSNKTDAYVWLEDSLRRVAANDSSSVQCRGSEKGKMLNPVLFVVGGCPNSMCGMQAVMFAADASKTVDFWWVKPSKQTPGEIEQETLNYQETGKHRNAPGRSRPFYQPLADLFQQGVHVRKWIFGLKPVSHAGREAVRAFVYHEQAPDEVLYILILWQEDFPLNPFARTKYIKGKIVYQRCFDSEEYFLRQYELHDGTCYIADFEEGPVSKVLPGDNVKALWDLGLPPS